jgi:predicted aspartyl protease
MKLPGTVTRNQILAIPLALAMVTTCSTAGLNPRSLSQSTPPGNRVNPNNQKLQLPFRLSHDLLVEIDGRIDILRHLRFVLDTGTTQTVIDKRLADRLQLSCKPGNPLVNFGQTLKLKQCILPDLEISSFRMKRLPVYVADFSRLSTLLDDADVLVGLDVLGSSRFTLDYEAREVTFDSIQPPLAPSDPNDPVCMTAVIQVQGQPMRLILDTAAQGVLIYQGRLRSKLPHLRTLGTPENVSLGGSLPAKRLTLPGVRIGELEASTVVLLIPGPPDDVLPGIDGYLGVSELRARRMTLDFVAKTLSWER